MICESRSFVGWRVLAQAPPSEVIHCWTWLCRLDLSWVFGSSAADRFTALYLEANLIDERFGAASWKMPSLSCSAGPLESTPRKADLCG